MFSRTATTSLLMVPKTIPLPGLVILPVLLVIFFIILKTLAQTEGGKSFLDGLALKTPILGPVVKMTIVARFTRTLGTLLNSGVPILEALNICRGSIGNVHLQNALKKVHDAIKEGETMAEPLGKSGIFDDMVVNMIDVGEETGELDKMLIRIADNYDDQVDVKLNALISILEPLLIVVMGGCVAVIVFAIFLPMLTIVESIGLTHRDHPDAPRAASGCAGRADSRPRAESLPRLGGVRATSRTPQ
jgi:type IV pilus assembly protein PilC